MFKVLIFIILLALIVLPELYITMKYITKLNNVKLRKLYFLTDVYVGLVLILMLVLLAQTDSPAILFCLGMMANVAILFVVSKLVFVIVDSFSLLFKSAKSGIRKAALFVSMLVSLSYLYGMMFGRFNFTPKEVVVESADIPKSFDGYKIIHISDLHLGSFYGSEDEIQKLSDMMTKENADALFFTGDIVSVIAKEGETFVSTLSTIKVKDTKIAVLGNHDYGDYHKWKNKKDKDANLVCTKEMIGRCGFDLLCNDSRLLTKNGDTIAVVGTENWGKIFCKYADLESAEKNVSQCSSRILLSHDPDFWDYELKEDAPYFLTLSGHTHAMQFGIEVGDFEASPASLKYEKYHGLYERNNGKQKLFVSRGVGSAGMPFRLGMSPEYVVITLKRKE